MIGRGYGRRRRGLGVRSKIPKGQGQRYQQESHGQLAPRDFDGRLSGGLGGGPSGIFLAEAAGERIGCSSLSGMRITPSFVTTSLIATSFTATILIAASFVAAVFIPAIFIIATTLFAALLRRKHRGLGGRAERLQAVGLRDLRVLALKVAVIALGIGGGKVGTGKNGFYKLIDVRLVRFGLGVSGLGRVHRAGFRLWGAKIRQHGLAQGGYIVGYRFFFIESDLAGVGADETSIEDAAGKLLKVFFFQGTQHADADFCGVGDGLEFEATLLALFAKFFSEDTHVRLLLSFRPQRHPTIIGEGGGGCQKGCVMEVTGGWERTLGLKPHVS